MSMTSSSLTGSIQLDQFEDHFGNAAEIHLCLTRSEQQPSIYNSDALRSRGTQSQSQEREHSISGAIPGILSERWALSTLPCHVLTSHDEPRVTLQKCKASQL